MEKKWSICSFHFSYCYWWSHLIYDVSNASLSDVLIWLINVDKKITIGGYCYAIDSPPPMSHEPYALHISLMPSISAWSCIAKTAAVYKIQSTLDISNSDISNSARLEASIWIKNTFWSVSPTIIWHWILFYKSILPEVQINLHFG